MPLLISLLATAGCATLAPVSDEPASVNINELRALLGFTEEEYELGFKQTKFNPCGMDIMPLKAGRCGTEYYSTVSMQILCRKTTGTVSEVGPEYALYDSNLRWSAGGLRGRIRLDEDGFGLIQMRSIYPKGRAKIKIISGNDFLYMTVGDLKKVVVPGNWCS